LDQAQNNWLNLDNKRQSLEYELKDAEFKWCEVLIFSDYIKFSSDWENQRYLFI